MARQKADVVVPTDSSDGQAIEDGRPMRADARRNRELLVATAREVFSEQGAAASMEAIAKRAGVGVGTLYSHFPNRLDLVEAVYQTDLEELVTGPPVSAAFAADGTPTPAAAGFAAKQGIEVAALERVETPKGAYWNGVGAPSWKHLVRWKAYAETDELEVQPETALRNVVTDKYFREVKEPTDKNLRVPRMMAWSLTYFLAEKKTDGLLRYFDELNNLPRDLEFDDAALLACFGRALDLMDTASPTQVNPGKLSKLANEWYQFIHYTNLEASEAYNDLVEELKEKIKARTGGRRRPPRQQPAAPPTAAQPPK